VEAQAIETVPARRMAIRDEPTIEAGLSIRFIEARTGRRAFVDNAFAAIPIAVTPQRYPAAPPLVELSRPCGAQILIRHESAGGLRLVERSKTKDPPRINPRCELKVSRAVPGEALEAFFGRNDDGRIGHLFDGAELLDPPAHSSSSIWKARRSIAAS